MSSSSSLSLIRSSPNPSRFFIPSQIPKRPRPRSPPTCAVGLALAILSACPLSLALPADPNLEAAGMAATLRTPPHHRHLPPDLSRAIPDAVAPLPTSDPRPAPLSAETPLPLPPRAPNAIINNNNNSGPFPVGGVLDRRVKPGRRHLEVH